MPKLFSEFQAPQPRRLPIDPAQITNILAAPQVAAQQRKAQLFQAAAGALGELPQRLFADYVLAQQLKQSQAEAKRKALGDTPVDKASPALYNALKLKGYDLTGVPLGQVKEHLEAFKFLPKPPKKVITPEEAIKAGTIDPETTEIIRPAAKTGAQNVLLGIVDRYNALPEVKGAKELAINASRAKGLINSNSPIAQEAAKFALARAIQGGGVLTDQDVNRLGGAKSVKARAQSALAALHSGNLGALDRKFLLDLSDSMERQATKQLLISKTSYAKQKGKVLEKFGIGTTDDLINILDIDLSGLKESRNQSGIDDGNPYAEFGATRK